MNYRRLLAVRWSRRDWLAAVIISLVAALLVGATVLVMTAGEQMTALVEQFDSNATVTHYDSVEAARAAAPSTAVVVPVATATAPTGETQRVIGLPSTATENISLPAAPTEPARPGGEGETWLLQGTDSTQNRTLSADQPHGVFPSSWIRADAATVEAVGPTEALVFAAQAETTPTAGTPLVSVLAFVVDGTSGIVRLLVGGVAIAGVIVAVTVASIVQTTIRDRERTIRVARATGAPSRQIRWPLSLRAVLLVGVGVVIGYSSGLILTNAAVNAAVAGGLPTTLAIRVTPTVAAVLASMCLALTGIGGLAGYVTARRALAGPVVATGADNARRIPSAATGRLTTLPGGQWLMPRVLSVRTVRPVLAILVAFSVLILLVGALGGVGASLNTAETTLTEPGAAHPVNSQLPEAYAAAIATPSRAASPEILLFAYTDGEPFLARGGTYDAFANVTGAALVTGERPQTPTEAVIGGKLADTLGVEVGETLTIGGSTDQAVSQVTIAGEYTTGGIDDHQLLVPLETARHLAGLEQTAVHLIRTDANVEAASDTSVPIVLGVDTPAYVQAGDPVPVTVRLWSPTATQQTRTISATVGNATRDERVTVAPRERMTTTISIDDVPVGEYTVGVDEQATAVTVTETLPLTVTVPDVLPPAESVQVRVTTRDGTPVSAGTVSLGNNTAQLTSDGTAWLQSPSARGTYELRVENGSQQAQQTVRVEEQAAEAYTPRVTTQVTPAQPSATTRPVVTVQIQNPWNRTLERAITVTGPGTTVTEPVTLSPGGQQTVEATLDRRPAGEYTVTVTDTGQQLASTTYRVVGDTRLGAALATGGLRESGGGGLGSAIEYAVGNISVLLGVLTGLTIVTVIGALSAVIARAVRANQQVLGIYRATGATPGQILILVGKDAVRIGGLAALPAVLIGTVVVSLASVGEYLTVFGIALDPWPSLTLTLAIIAGSLLLTGIAAVLVTVPRVTRSIAPLLATQPTSARDDNSNKR